MNKSGFTMMELVFVIVVIGILAGLAVTKLMATRDDAEYSKAIQNINVLVRDLSDFYASQGMAGIPVLKEHSGNETDVYGVRDNWNPGNIAAMSNVPLDGPMDRGRYSFKVAGKECFTLWLNVVDFYEQDGAAVADQIDRDLLILKFYKNKTNTSASCVRVQNSDLFNNFNADPNDGGAIRLFNQKVTYKDARGAENDYSLAVTGGLIAGQDRGLFDESEQLTDEEIEQKKKLYGGRNIKSIF